MPTIGNAPSGEDTSLDGTEKVPTTGNKFILISKIRDYIAGYYNTLVATLTNKTLTTPAIGDFTNAQHDHSDTANGGTAVGGGGGTDVFENLTTSETDTSLVAAPDGAGGLEFRAETGGAGTLLKSYWSVDAPPVSPTSQDDEFDDGSLDGKWTEYDPNSVLTVTESGTYKHLILSCVTRTGFNPVGIAQTIPAGDFTIYGLLKFRSTITDYTIAGLAMYEDITDVSKDIIIFGASPRNAETPLGVLYYTASTTFSSQTLAFPADFLPTSLYLRIRRNSTNYFYDISSDGISWIGNAAAVNPAFTPTKFGVALDNANTGITITASFPFFRYIASDVGINGILAGQVAGIYQ